MQIFEQNNLVDIWRIHNPTLKQYTFRKHNLSGFNSQEYFKKGNILTSFCSDHSPISYILESSSEKYVTQMKQHIAKVKSQFSPAFGNKAHVQWEFLKYEIRKFSIELSKNKAKLRHKKLSCLEVKLKELEQNLSNVTYCLQMRN